MENTTKPGRLTGLESLRGAAALSIVLFHVRFLPPLEAPATINRFVSTFGSSVPLFYAISAFSLFVGYERALERPAGLRKFYIRRFFRIAPLFYAMLGVHLLMRAFYFHAETQTREVLVNMTFVFGLLPGIHEGLVWASWSIGVEWLFYALFPLFLILGRNVWSTAGLLVGGLLISVNTPQLLQNIARDAPSFGYMCFLNQLAFFCAGVLAYRLARLKAQTDGAAFRGTRWLVSWGLVGASLAWLWCGWFTPLNGPLDRAHLAVHWPVVAWIALLVGTFVGLPWLVDNFMMRYAGRLSFGLYLTNPPVVFALSKFGVFAWIYSRMHSPSWAFVLCSLTALSMVALTAQAAFSLIERPGILLGDWLLAWLKARANGNPEVQPQISCPPQSPSEPASLTPGESSSVLISAEPGQASDYSGTVPVKPFGQGTPEVYWGTQQFALEQEVIVAFPPKLI
jgi:peptidoglycan/LPS O-acetylase OafA/YrhL